MSDFTRRTATGADAGDMPYPLHELDRDPEGLRLERYTHPENPEIVAFRVVDSSGRVRGFMGFEYDAMEKDLPQRTLERVQRAIRDRPTLRLVG